MEFDIDSDWRGRYVQAAHSVTTGERTALARMAASGRLLRVAPGVYRGGDPLESRDDAYRELVYAHDLRTRGRRVFSHESAAVLWRLPIVGGWPSAVHVADRAGGGHSSHAVRRHAGGIPGVVDLIDGVRVTPLVRTLVDLARTRSLADSVAALDAALSGNGPLAAVAPDPLEEEFGAIGMHDRGSARARLALELADGASGSPGESLSRVNIHRAGFPKPVLQFRIDDRAGPLFVDFCWPDLKIVGEFDGVAKYVRDEWTRGRDPAHVVIDEKWREDRIRAAGWRVVRWGWEVARSPALLAQRLSDAGLARMNAHVRAGRARCDAPA